VPDYATYTYDLMGRQTSVATGDGGSTTTCYSDDAGASCASGLPFKTVSTELVQSGVSKTTTAISTYTGSSGAPTTTTQLNSDPSCAGGTVNVDTIYDADLRKWKVSNPYCTNNPNAATSGTTTYTYDGLSRLTQVQNPDGTSSTNQYTGRAVLSSDEGNGTKQIQRISQTDALGRLIYVCELTSTVEQGASGTPASCGSLDISGTGFLTTYGYDASNSSGPLESVTSVTQGGESRSFIYAPGGWLTSATNPESGTTNYTSYDNDGNLLSKTDAKGITTTYSWDQLDRLTGKSYNDGKTPAACSQYDGSANGIGRLATEWTESGSCPTSGAPSSGAITMRSFGYDLLGRVTTDLQCISTSTISCGGIVGQASVGYTYDYAGDVASFTNGLQSPSALAFSNSYNTAGRLATMTAPDNPNSGTGPFSLFSNPTYSPSGALAGAEIGTNIALTRTYNNRLLPTGETDMAGTAPGTAKVGVGGNEQMFIQGIGTITFSGSEQSKTVNGSTVYDDGTFEVSLAGEQPFQITYGQGSTPQTIAAGFASTWLAPCSSGLPWTGYASGATVYIASCTPLTSWTLTTTLVGCSFNTTGCSFSATTGGATASIAISESTGTLTSGNIAMGVFAATGGAPKQTKTVSWGAADTPNSVAANLAAAFGSCSTSGNLVGATASGATVTLISCQTGQEYTISQDGGACGCGPGTAYFNATVNGVVDGGDVYDSGTATLTVNNTQIATTSWGEYSTNTSVMQSLASAASSNNLVNVAYSSSNGELTLTAYDDGTSSTDYPYSLTTTDTSGLSVTPSFEGGSGTLAGSNDAVLYSWSIPASGGYAPNGDVLSVTDTVMGTWSYGYDDMNRLSSATATANGTGAQDSGMTLTWTYDRYGNRWSQTASGTGGGSATQPQLSFNGNNQIAGAPSLCTVANIYCYDKDGNLLNDGLNQYTYDAEGRISSINGGVGYVYDAEGNRVAKTNSSGVVTSVYILTAGNQQVTELDSGTWAHSNIYAPGGRLLATYDAPGQASPGYHYNLTDWLGTKRMQTTSGGAQQEICVSNPFGDGLSCTGGTDATEQHFTGKERDAESGNDYFGARYYASTVGRWLSPDKGMTLKRILPNPQRWNRYAYVINNPLVRFDPDGLTDFAVFITYTQADLGTHAAPDWGGIQNRAAINGNTVTIYSGSTGDHAANAANWNAARQNGQVAVYVGHTDLADTGNGQGTRAVALHFEDPSVGNPDLHRNDGAATVAPTPTNGGTVALFGCDSANLVSQYSGANNFVGVDSGYGTSWPGMAQFADITTSIPGLAAAGSEFVDLLASQAYVTPDSISDAVSSADPLLYQNPTYDTGDQLIQQTNTPQNH
jgi:RHS repeat-associated protein